MGKTVVEKTVVEKLAELVAQPWNRWNAEFARDLNNIYCECGADVELAAILPAMQKAEINRLYALATESHLAGTA